MLKYYDEDDGDMITLGSSRELKEKLEEPILPPSSSLPAKIQHGIQYLENHVFEIDNHDYIRNLWNDIQNSSRNMGKLPVAQDLGDGSVWTAEKNDSLAMFYEKRRAELWKPLAEELGVTWQSVDAMHWALGREEMARRADRLNPHSEQSLSSKGTAKKQTDFTDDSTGTLHFGGYRVHHFNATRPPRVQLPNPVAPQPIEATAGQATISNVDPDCSASSDRGKNGDMNLAAEGRRQTKAAGDELRSTAVDSHRNRWANYKSSTSAFLPKASTSVSPAFDGPGLTSEGKRQAQVAGDKLRCRTNPIRHSRLSKLGSLENEIGNNRWSSYSGTRATRFCEHQDVQDAQDEARDNSNTANTNEVPKNDKPSLLEVFEAELAKKTSATESQESLESVSPAAQTPESAVQVDASSESQGQPLIQGSHAVLGLINEHLHELTAGDMALSQDFSTAIDRGIRGLGACVQGIARGLQEVSSISRQAADRTRDADLRLIDDAVFGFRSLIGGFTAALGRETAPNQSRIPFARHTGSEESETGSSPSSVGISYDECLEKDMNIAHKGNASCLDSGGHKRPAISEEAPIHKPGPIHIPDQPGYVDHLRRSQSSTVSDEQHNIQRASSPPLDTHFPTLDQFEAENFRRAPDFPALPSMEPLTPQPAAHANKYDSGDSEPATGSLSFVSVPHKIEATRQSYRPVAGRHEDFMQQSRHESIPSSRLGSAARLAEPFDPLNAEPSARPYVTERLRRNATIAGSDIEHAARRRRPYSEVFDGSGRVPWRTFLLDNGRERRGPYRARDDRGRPLDAKQDHPKRLSRPEAGSRRSPLPAVGYDDQHQDDSSVGKINDCVSVLRDLGFGGEDDESAARLLVYAQAADGVLVDAIDLIDEEQRAWQRL